METMERKKSRPRRSFTPELKVEIVERCRRGDRSIGQVARDFDLGETAVRAWVHQAETAAGDQPGLRPRNGPNSSSCVGRTGGCVKQDLQGWRGYEQRRSWTPSPRHTQTPAKRGPLGISHLDVEHDVNSMIRSISPHESHTQRCQFPKTQLICRKA